jgi:hypothetical protein
MDLIDSLRQFRVGGFALFDFAVSFLGMLALSPLLTGLFKRMGVHVPKRNWVILTLPISVLVHTLVGKMTPLTKDFLDPSGHYLAKAIMIVCLFFGIYGIRRIRPGTKIHS